MNAKDIAIVFPKIEIVLKDKNSGKTTVKKGSKTTEYKININQVTATEQDYWSMDESLNQPSSVKDEGPTDCKLLL